MFNEKRNPYLIEGMSSIVAGNQYFKLLDMTLNEDMGKYAKYLNSKICPEIPDEIYFNAPEKSLCRQWIEEQIQKHGFNPYGRYQQIAKWIVSDPDLLWLQDSRNKRLKKHRELANLVWEHSREMFFEP